MDKRPWNRLLWGVEFQPTPTSEPTLIGGAWSDRPHHPDEPTRALLFTTKKLALAWCQEQNQKWAARADNARWWRVRPVRVRETVARHS